MCDIGKNHLSLVSGSNAGDPQAEDLANSMQEIGEEVLRACERLKTLLNARKTPAKRDREDVAESLAAIIEVRKERGRFFPACLFGDAAWDILLHLLSAELQRVPVSFTQLAERANIPPTSANRWIAVLVDRGMLIRHDDPTDARRTFVELHPNTSAALRELVGKLSPRGT